MHQSRSSRLLVVRRRSPASSFAAIGVHLGSRWTPNPIQMRADRRPSHHAYAEAEARRLSQPIPIAKADRRAGVRADQASTRISTIPAARPRSREGGMGADLHRPQHHTSSPRRSEGARSKSSPRRRYLDGLLAFTAQASPPPLLTWILVRRPLITRTCWLGS